MGSASRRWSRYSEYLRHNKTLDRFTLRGHAKVNAQWQLFCLVQNIEEFAHHGYAQ